MVDLWTLKGTIGNWMSVSERFSDFSPLHRSFGNGECTPIAH